MARNKFLMAAVLGFCLLGLTACTELYEKLQELPENFVTGSSEIVHSRERESATEQIIEPQVSWPESQGHISWSYAREQLSEAERCWYDDIYEMLMGQIREGDLDPAYINQISSDRIEDIFQCVLNDHPEIFYVTGYHYTQYKEGSKVTRITFAGDYAMDGQEIALKQQQIENYVSACLSGLGEQATQYEKVKYVYEYLIDRTEYNLEAAENQNICSVFVGGQSVCQGYAKAMQFLMNRLGMQCTLVTGIVENGERHAWNLVSVDDRYYYVDVTWGDVSYQVREQNAEVMSGAFPAVNYDYLCNTSQQLAKTHTIDNVVPMPECTSMEANYYVMEGAYFTAYDQEQLNMLFEKGYDQGREDIALKCSDEQVYQEIFDKLITEHGIFDLLKSGDGRVAYSENQKLFSLTFWLVED